MKKEQKQIVFLTYIARSGSTYLSKLLSEYDDVGVTIEGDLPDGLKGRDLFEVNESGELDPALDCVYSNPKFREWSVERAKLKSRLLEHNNLPLDFNRLLTVVLDLYFENNHAKIFVYKCAIYRAHMDRMRTMFPGAKFILLLRDPRAIFRSQKRSLHSETKRPMQSNPVATALNFKKTVTTARDHKRNEWLHILKYEDLIPNTNEEMASLLKFLGVENKIRINQSRYFDTIPDKQKHLHQNLKAGPIKDRIDAWKNDLTASERLSIRIMAGRSMIWAGYDPASSCVISLSAMVGFVVYLARYCVWLIVDKMRRAVLGE